MLEILDSLSPIPPNLGLTVPAGWEVRYLLTEPGPSEPMWAKQFRRLNKAERMEILVVVMPAEAAGNRARTLFEVDAWLTATTYPKIEGVERTLVLFHEDRVQEDWEALLTTMAHVNRSFN